MKTWHSPPSSLTEQLTSLGMQQPFPIFYQSSMAVRKAIINIAILTSPIVTQSMWILTFGSNKAIVDYLPLLDTGKRRIPSC